MTVVTGGRRQMVCAQSKSMFNGVPDTWETKTVRRVRTPAGEKRFGQPIGSIIIGGGVGKKLKNITLMDSDYAGFDKVKTNKGKEFYIGKYDGEDDIVVTDSEGTSDLFTTQSLEEAFGWLDANPTGKGNKPPTSGNDDDPPSPAPKKRGTPAASTSISSKSPALMSQEDIDRETRKVRAIAGDRAVPKAERDAAQKRMEALIKESDLRKLANRSAPSAPSKTPRSAPDPDRPKRTRAAGERGLSIPQRMRADLKRIAQGAIMGGTLTYRGDTDEKVRERKRRAHLWEQLVRAMKTGDDSQLLKAVEKIRNEGSSDTEEHLVLMRVQNALGEKGDDMQALDYKAVPIGGVEDDGAGVVEALVAVTGIKDRVNDIILPGAFQKSLAARTPKGVWHHNITDSVSRTEEIKELAPGDPDLPETLPNGEPWPSEAGALKVKTRFNLKTQRGRDAYEDVKFFGTDQEWSIGYSVPTGGATIDRKSGVRKISTLDLFEYSPVLFGAMPNARTVSVKSAQEAHKVVLGLNTDEGREIKALWDEMVADEVKAAKKKRIAGNDEEETEESEQDSEKTPSTSGPDHEDETTESEEDNSEDAWDDDDSEVEEKPKKRKGTKSIELDAAGIDMLDTAVKALTGLRDHIIGAVTEVKADDKGTESSGESLASLVDSAGLDVSDAASAFDTAVSDNDSAAMEDAGNTVLDAVEAAKDSEDADTGALKRVTAFIASAFENVEPEEPTEEKSDDADSEDQGSEEQQEVESVEEKGEVITLDRKELFAQFGVDLD